MEVLSAGKTGNDENRIGKNEQQTEKLNGAQKVCLNWNKVS